MNFSVRERVYIPTVHKTWHENDLVHFLSVFAFIGVIMPIICIFVCFIMIKKAMSAMSQTIDTNLDKDAEQLKKSFSVRTSKQEEAVTRYFI